MMEDLRSRGGVTFDAPKRPMRRRGRCGKLRPDHMQLPSFPDPSVFAQAFGSLAVTKKKQEVEQKILHKNLVNVPLRM